MEKDRFSEWFDEVLFRARILDTRYPVKGFSVYRDWGVRILRYLARMVEEELERDGHIPVLFPVVIPEDLFRKESKHLKGFEGEVFWVTRGGETELPRKLVLRPTSETAMYPIFAYWIRSHADLPLKVHQTVTIYRYETKATRPLYRMREFVWNEAHTAHRTWEEAEEQVRKAVEMYKRILHRVGVSYLLVKRPEFDKFAGAVYSLAFDAWNPDGKVNQVGTVHNLGENFSRVFEITYEDVGGVHRYVVQTCYGIGLSRLMAAIIAQHGDDHGLVLPPEVAPVQVVVVPIPYKGFEESVKEHSRRVYEALREAGIRVYVDEEERTRPGEKFYYWEAMGVPVRAEVGPKDVESGAVTLVRRDTFERVQVPLGDVVDRVRTLFSELMENIRRRSWEELRRRTLDAESVEDVARGLKEAKICRVCWCGRLECVERIKEETGGEIRGTLYEVEERAWRPCVVCGSEAKQVVYIARAY